MLTRLYEDHLPIQLEYFVGNVSNKVKFLREAEMVQREKTVVDHLFKNALNGILKITDKFEKPLDTSKGDIKRVVGSKELLATINKLSKNYSEKQKDILSSPVNSWGLDEYIALSRKAYLYISNLSRDFVQGYRRNNLLIMSTYKGLVSNLFSLVGECVSFTITGEEVDYRSLRVKNLRDFVEAYENGSFQKSLEDSKTLLEEFLDEPNMVLYESYDIVQSGVKFLKRIINNFDRDDKIGNFVYKAVDFIKQIVSLKQLIWPLVVNNLLPKMSEYILLFKGFLGDEENMSNQTSKIANQILSNSARADDRANYLISMENDSMYNQIQKSWNDKKEIDVETVDEFKF